MSKCLIGCLCLMTFLGVMSMNATAQPTPPTEDLIAGHENGPWRRLFLDAMVVEQREGLARQFHTVQKYEGNPVIRGDKPWEISGPRYKGPYIHGTVLWDEGKLRMWYRGDPGGPYNCYAESEDGIHWRKPNLGIVEYKGSKDSNIFLSVTLDPKERPRYKGAGQCNFPCIFKQPEEKDPQKRYALLCRANDYRTQRVAFSPDGLHWNFVFETAKKGLFTGGDATNYFYDPYNKRYAAAAKCTNRRGRAIGMAFSRGMNVLAWGEPTVVFVADDLDPDAAQIYGMPVFAYQGMYIGLPWIYHARWFKYGEYTDQRMIEAEKDSPCTTDVQLAWSWDLINWTRTPKREPFIPLGKEGEFDSSQIYTANAPVQVGDQLCFYYGGCDRPHNSPYTTQIGLATLRLDGFCSMHAGDREGRLISRREVLQTPQVTINAKTAEGGYVLCEILDRNNRVLQGFSRGDCVPFTGDSVRHVMEWKAKEFAEAQKEGEKKFRFFVKKADLYSYLP